MYYCIINMCVQNDMQSLSIFQHGSLASRPFFSEQCDETVRSVLNIRVIAVVAVAQTISCCFTTMEAWLQSQISSCEICGGQSGTGTGFSLSTLVYPTHRHSINTAYAFVHLSPVVCNLYIC